MLRNADLREANLRNADLHEANLKNANLSKVKLEGSQLTKAKYNSKTQWPDNFDYENSGAILEEDVV